MDAIGIIPARYGSTRFPGKVIAELCGKPIIQWVWEKASEAKYLDELVVATDDDRIESVVRSFGGKVVFTAKEHLTGTDRLTEVVNPIDTKIIVNIQADEPLIHPTMIDDVTTALLENPTINMATVAKKIEGHEQIMDHNVVKVVMDTNGFALYFSRSPIPYVRYTKENEKKSFFYKHIGLYSYTKDFLFTFTNLPVLNLEKSECLEQLRALENGYRIKVIETKYDTIGVDTPRDLERIKDKLKFYNELQG